MKQTTSQTFSNFNLTGLGLVAVTASAISLPILNACSLVAPFNNTNILKRETDRYQRQYISVLSRQKTINFHRQAICMFCMKDIINYIFIKWTKKRTIKVLALQSGWMKCVKRKKKEKNANQM